MTLRAVVASFDAIAMVALAFTVTGASLADPTTNVIVWGSAAAAVAAALVVLTRGPAMLGWAAVGYVIFAALLVSARPVPLLLLLAVAFMPILERPRGSLALGLVIALFTAGILAAAVRAL